MWRNLVTHLTRYPTMVITAVDTDGFPVSFRCQPQLDPERQVIVVDAPPGLDLQPGPANLLGHFHDDALWNQHSVLIRGTLSHNRDRWELHPEKVTPGLQQGLVTAFKTLGKSRADARRYLDRKGPARPVVPWHRLDALKKS